MRRNRGRIGAEHAVEESHKVPERPRLRARISSSPRTFFCFFLKRSEHLVALPLFAGLAARRFVWWPTHEDLRR